MLIDVLNIIENIENRKKFNKVFILLGHLSFRLVYFGDWFIRVEVKCLFFCCFVETADLFALMGYSCRRVIQYNYLAGDG